MVSVRAALSRSGDAPIVLFGDARQLRQLVGLVSPSAECHVVDALDPVVPVPERVYVLDTGAVDEALLAHFAAQPETGEAQLATLQAAALAVRDGRARALVTGPTSKAAIVAAGHPFIGQTEFLAALDGRAPDDVTMLFLGPVLRVALVTTHLAIADVPAAITAARVMRSARHLAAALLALSPQAKVRLALTGLNPHAGEAGLFGREEIDVIEPALVSLRREPPFATSEAELFGPWPAEAVFRAAQRGDLEGVVAMFHDQATIASKLLDWGAAVNTTWGLSFLRTSVDHGVAYDAAAEGRADHAGMCAALDLALRLTRPVASGDHG